MGHDTQPATPNAKHLMRNKKQYWTRISFVIFLCYSFSGTHTVLLMKTVQMLT
jgi:hypothetical protein